MAGIVRGQLWSNVSSRRGTPSVLSIVSVPVSRMASNVKYISIKCLMND